MWLGFHGTEEKQLHGTRKEMVRAEMMLVFRVQETLSQMFKYPGKCWMDAGLA